MKIYVDADACPVNKIIENVAREYRIDVEFLCDTNHILNFDYGNVVTVGAGTDAVDLVLINKCNKGDIVVSQDFGVAALALTKNSYAINQNGMYYTNQNIDDLLMHRYISKVERKKSKNNKCKIKGPKKRTKEDDQRFESSLRKLINDIINN